MIDFHSFVISCWRHDLQWSFCPQIITYELPADHVVEPLLINGEDLWGRVTESDHQMEYIFGSEGRDSWFEVNLIGVEPFEVVPVILVSLEDPFCYFSWLVDPPDKGDCEVDDVGKDISALDVVEVL